MFFGTFAWAFVFISSPFHIQRVSPIGLASLPLAAARPATVAGAR